MFQKKLIIKTSAEDDGDSNNNHPFRDDIVIEQDFYYQLKTLNFHYFKIDIPIPDNFHKQGLICYGIESYINKELDVNFKFFNINHKYISEVSVVHDTIIGASDLILMSDYLTIVKNIIKNRCNGLSEIVNKYQGKY